MSRSISAMNLEFPVYHVLVIGFHHKKGCQVEYTFPPLDMELEKSAWKHLPTLAMPDGAHNFDRDTVYFHLPSLKDPNQTIFGVACFQQIQSSTLKNKPEDVTRSTVQKAVCVLSRFPLFGHIQVKMSLITAAYFREGDFDQVSILEEAFHNLNACLTADLLYTPEAFVGLSPRELVFLFRHQIVLLFKLLLLEKRVLFHGNSVGPLCSSILTLVSLLPGTLEHGLNQSACIRTAKNMSIVPQFSKEEEEGQSSSPTEPNGYRRPGPPRLRTTTEIEPEEIKSEKPAGEFLPKSGSSPALISPTGSAGANAVFYSGEAGGVELGDIKPSEEIPDFLTAVQLSADEAGLPLNLFVKGYLCHPYLSLHYLDLLADSRVRGFVVAATNVLFKHKRDLVDVIVEMSDGSIEIIDPVLRRQLTLTTPDLRFAENLVKQVTSESERRSEGDNFMDGVGWEGGDEWIRAQFKYYLMCVMRTSQTEEGQGQGSRARDSFSAPFISAWQSTHNWRVWNDFVNSEERETPGIFGICPGHPCEGSMSVSDMKIRLAHTMQNTEGGRRLNQAVTSTGKAFGQTGKAVGGAFSTAKGALSSWWNNVTTTVIPAPPADLSPPYTPAGDKNENEKGNSEAQEKDSRQGLPSSSSSTTT